MGRLAYDVRTVKFKTLILGPPKTEKTKQKISMPSVWLYKGGVKSKEFYVPSIGCKGLPIDGIDDQVFDLITVRDSIVLRFERELGVYQLGTARVEVTTNRGSNTRERRYDLMGAAENYPDIQDLFEGVKSGTLKPVVSYDQEQI